MSAKIKLPLSYRIKWFILGLFGKKAPPITGRGEYKQEGVQLVDFEYIPFAATDEVKRLIPDDKLISVAKLIVEYLRHYKFDDKNMWETLIIKGEVKPEMSYNARREFQIGKLVAFSCNKDSIVNCHFQLHLVAVERPVQEEDSDD
jgi:hypothetical protein